MKRFLKSSTSLKLTLGLLLLTPAALAADTVPSLPPAQHPGSGQIYYFVMTDRFENGDTTNDKGGSTSPLRAAHGFDPTNISYFHGGDFKGLTNRLTYIADLGATSIWITPPFKNKPTQGGSAGYHGYWILDFLNVDPHLGSDTDFRTLLSQAHTKGLKVIPDIVVNHTADALNFGSGHAYRSKGSYPLKTSAGASFDDRTYVFNGLGSGTFPALSSATSFPWAPSAPAVEDAKNPAFLNDATNYHNRGDSSYTGEDYNYGDVAGLDDTFTEKPEVVRGFIDIYTHWITDYDIDGYRIDTMKHVNPEFWQAFAPALRDAAAKKGRPDFFHFGEVFNGDANYLAQWPTHAKVDSVLDFALLYKLRDYVSHGYGASAFETFFDLDDLYTHHNGNARSLVTFNGNHDVGRFGYFLRQDNVTSIDSRMQELMRLGYGLLFLLRGDPVIYYGDEQGMIGTGGDTGAREDMFASQSSSYASLSRIGSNDLGGVAKFNEAHPLFVAFKALAQLRAANPALARGAMMIRSTASDTVFSFSRLSRDNLVEYVITANNSRTTAKSVLIPTAQRAGVIFRRVFDSRTPTAPGSASATTDAQGRLPVSVDPVAFSVWKADTPLPSTTPAPTISLATPAANAVLSIGDQTTEGQTFPSRVELRATVGGVTDYAEVTFLLARSDRPGQYELLGVDDAPPYRVYWRPPADLPAGTTFSVLATVDTLRGGRATTRVDGLTWKATGLIPQGITGSTTPRFVETPHSVSARKGDNVVFRSSFTGSTPLECQWFHNDFLIQGATSASLSLSAVTANDGGTYTVIARNAAGTAVSEPVTLTVDSSAGPFITQQPLPATVAPSGSVTLSVAARAETAVTYQWFKDNIAVSGATDAALTLQNLTSADEASYTVQVTASGNTVTSTAARLVVAAPVQSRLFNLSVRSTAGAGDQTLIAGFYIAGDGTRQILMRGIGPTLEAFHVAGALPDPQLIVYDSAHTAILSNDNWGGGDTLAQAFAGRGAFALPGATLDAALLVPLSSASYTVHLSGNGGTTGIGLVELYDELTEGARFTNLSARSQVGVGDEVLIAGFVVTGNTPKRVLVRAIGPTLGAFGVSSVLADPQLALRQLNVAQPVASNDDWEASTETQSAFTATGAFNLPPGSRDAALIATLWPGPYTAAVNGAGATSGVALVEVYELP